MGGGRFSPLGYMKVKLHTQAVRTVKDGWTQLHRTHVNIGLPLGQDANTDRQIDRAVLCIYKNIFYK